MEQLDLFSDWEPQNKYDIKDFVCDSQQFNRGTNKGTKILVRSLKELGCGRSVLSDNENNIIAGVKVFEAAKQAGIRKIRVIETQGNELIIIKRTDISHGTKKQMEMSIVDNISSEQNLDWDADLIIETMNQNLSFDPRRWGGHNCIIKDLRLEDYLKDNVSVNDKKKQESKSDFDSDFIQLSLF